MHEYSGDGAKTSEAQSALVQARFSRAVLAAKNGDYSHLDEFIAVPDRGHSLVLAGGIIHQQVPGPDVPPLPTSAGQGVLGTEFDNSTPSMLPVSASTLQPSIPFLDDKIFLQSTVFAPAMFLRRDQMVYLSATHAMLQCESHGYDQLWYRTVDQTSESVWFWIRPLAVKVMPILTRP